MSAFDAEAERSEQRPILRERLVHGSDRCVPGGVMICARPDECKDVLAVGNRNGFFSDMYGAGSLRFFDVLNAWRSDGRLQGLELR